MTEPQLARVAVTRRAIAGGLAWKLGSQVTLQVFAFVVSLVVARLLLPAEYGLASLALAFAAFGVVFGEVSLGAALVQRDDITVHDAGMLTWFAAVVGVAISAVFAGASPLLARLVDTRGLTPLLLGISPIFFVSALGAVPSAVLSRQMRFRALELRVIAATVVSSGVAVVVAAEGGGAWALVGQQLAYVAVLSALAWVLAGSFPRRFDRARLSTLASFGALVLVSRLLFTLGANVDNLLVGAYLGASALGLYALAYNVVLIPLIRLGTPVQEVAFPALSALADPASVGRAWLRGNRLLLALILPVIAVVVVEADDFVDAALGPRWHGVAPILRLLAIGGAMQAGGRLTSSVLQAAGRPRAVAVWAAVLCAALVAAFAIGLHWQATGVAAGFAIVNGVLQPAGLLLVGRLTEVPTRAILASVRRPFEAGLVACAAMIALKLALPPLGALPQLLAVSALGVAVYAAYLLGLDAGVRAELAAVRTLARAGER